jgi:predicted nucleotidyltransferase
MRTVRAPATPDPSPISQLFNAYHRRILALLLLRPEQSFYVREIARLTKIPVGSLHRELTQFAESGLLLREPIGNQVRYQANRDCPVFEELASIFRKTEGLADVLREALAPLAKSVDLAFIFGSVAQGKEQSTSDVDVFVVGKASFAEVVQALALTHERLGREINPVVMSKRVFKDKVIQGDRFVTRIMKEPKLYLIGNTDDIGKFTQDRPVKKSRH